MLTVALSCMVSANVPRTLTIGCAQSPPPGLDIGAALAQRASANASGRDAFIVAIFGPRRACSCRSPVCPRPGLDGGTYSTARAARGMSTRVRMQSVSSDAAS